MATPAEIALLLPVVISRARKLTRNYHDGEDLAHDAILKALHASDSCQHHLGGWVYSILTSTFLTRMERVKSDIERVDRYSLEVEAQIMPDVDIELELRRVLRKINRLPKDQRVPLKLAVIGVEYEEIATLLKIPIGTVRSRIARAREALK